MPTNIEIEAKVLLNKEDYLKVIEHYKDSIAEEYSQTNYYIDTKNLDLKKAGMGLRIRAKNHKYVMTLKTPLSEGLLEKTEELTSEQYNLMKTSNAFPDNKIKTFITMLGFDVKDLIILASLKTERKDVKYESGIFSIDKNVYGTSIDYELEKEGNNLKVAEDFLVDVCNKCEIKEFTINKKAKSSRAISEALNK